MWEDAVCALSAPTPPPDAFPDQCLPSTSNEAGYATCDELEWQLPALDNIDAETCSDATSESHQTPSVHSPINGTVDPSSLRLVQKIELGLNAGTALVLSGSLGRDSMAQLSEQFEGKDDSLGGDDGSGFYESDNYDFQTCRMASEQPSIIDETQTTSSSPNMGASPVWPQAVRSLETDCANQPLPNAFQTPYSGSEDTNITASTREEDSEPRGTAPNQQITGSAQMKRNSGAIQGRSMDPNLVAPLALDDGIDSNNQKGRPAKRKKRASSWSRLHPKKRKMDKGEQVNLRAETVIWTAEEEELTYKWDSRERLWFTNTDNPEIVKVNGEFLLSQGEDIRVKVRPNAIFMPVVIEWKGRDTFEGYDEVEEDRRLEVDCSSVLHMVLYGEGGEGIFHYDS
ncbi:hypothetical protein NW767_015492 [Fusarium falciforme]|nr:hypothetical protein NW767_015492 [Fusarium falciforme]